MAQEFTAENVTAAMRTAVELKGADYVYPRGADGGCYYAVRDAEGAPQPSCIVGHVIHTIDPKLFEEVAEFELHKGSSEVIDSLHLYVNGLDAIPTNVRKALARAQARQDSGFSWEAALYEYENTLKALG